jgi:hypothetical protein
MLGLSSRGCWCRLGAISQIGVPATQCQGAEADGPELVCRRGRGYGAISRSRRTVEGA